MVGAEADFDRLARATIKVGLDEFKNAFGPSLQLSLPSKCPCQRDIVLGVDDCDGASLRCVSRGVAIVVAGHAGGDVMGMTDVEAVVGTTEDVYPRHVDDDAIVSAHGESKTV